MSWDPFDDLVKRFKHAPSRMIMRFSHSKETHLFEPSVLGHPKGASS